MAEQNYVYENRNPYSYIQEPALAQSAVNAAAIARDLPWETVYRQLLREVHELCRMPTDERCVKEMLRDLDFVQQPGRSVPYTAQEVRERLDEHAASGVTALVRLRGSGEGGHMMALVPEKAEDGTVRYVLKGTKHRGHWDVREVWIRWPDGQDHSPVARRKRKRPKSGRRVEQSADHEEYHYIQNNPAANNIGDCVVRGVASTLGIGWHEAVDALAKAGRCSYTVINSTAVFELFLQQQGFTRHAKILRDGRQLTGKEFCKVMTRTYQNGERIFAYVGNTHVAAVLPLREADGSIRYKIEDSWDSSNRKINWYWVKEQEVPQEPEDAGRLDAESLVPGAMLVHPRFGTGRVQSVSGEGEKAILAIEFPDAGVKKLAVLWVTEHCRPAIPTS